MAIRKKLWLAVKQHIVQSSQTQKTLLPPTNQPLQDFLTAAFQNLLQFYQDHPSIQRLIQWQRLEKEQDIDLQKLQSAQLIQWQHAIKAYQKQSVINPKLDPHFTTTLILSLISAIGLDANVLLDDPSKKPAYIEFTVAHLMRMLTSPT